MKRLQVGAAVLNQTPMDWRGNARNARRAIELARARGVTLLCLPELCLTGYGCEDAFHMADTHRRAWESLCDLLPETRGMVVAFGLPVLHRNALFNCVALGVNGSLVGLVAKRFLAGDGIHYEPRWFKEWPAGIREQHVASDGLEVPMGDLYFEVGDIRLGFEICEDAWVAERPGVGLAAAGVDLILNPSASHFAFGKLEVRKRFVLEASRAFGVSYLYANLLGNEAGRAIYDGGALIATGGEWVAAGRRFQFADVDVTSAVIDVEATRMGRARTGSYRPRLACEHPLRVVVPMEWPPVQVPATPPISVCVGWEASPKLKEEEFLRAEALALLDYLRKSRAQGFVISLSGGADSAAVTCLVALSLEMALLELGLENLKVKLAHLRCHPGGVAAREWVEALVTTAYQATSNSGKTTRAAARQIATALGARHLELDVEPLHQGYVSMIERAMGRPLEWETDDVALQNIQARVRSPGIWLIANMTGKLLLATSNRSEAAVGYATMDGDTSGGLSPIGGIDKAFLRRWLQWLESEGPHGLQPIPALEAIRRQEPTAELRPAAQRQTDEVDLMPYPVLDAIERAAIRDKQSPVEVYERLHDRLPDYGDRELAGWICRFFELWSRNQWKRERYAPSFHLDDENLDPKTWCRWPILSGGFEEELQALRMRVEN